MREEYIIQNIVLWFSIIYVISYFKAKKEANMISFIVGLACYFIVDEILGGTIYVYMWASLTSIVSIYDIIKYRD